MKDMGRILSYEKILINGWLNSNADYFEHDILNFDMRLYDLFKTKKKSRKMEKNVMKKI